MRRRPTDSKTSLVNNTRSNRLYCLCDGGKEPGREGGRDRGGRETTEKGGRETEQKEKKTKERGKCNVPSYSYKADDGYKDLCGNLSS